MNAARSLALDDSRPVWQGLALFLLPLMLSNILQSISASLNQVFLGRMVGVQALAAVSSIFPLLFFLISFLIGLGSGATVLIGQAYGAGDHARVKAIAGTTISLALSLGVAVGALGFVTSGAILGAIGTPADIIPTSLGYAHITFLSLPLLFVYLVYTTFLRGIGDTRTPFAILIASTLLTAIVSPAFIGGWYGLPRLETNGAAAANVVASGISLTLLLVVLARRRSPLSLDREMLRGMLPHPAIVASIVRLGVPTGLNLVMISLSEIAVISFVNRFGSTATAAYGAVNQIVSYVQFPAISIGIAASVFGSQAIGAKRLERLPKIARAAVTLNYGIEGLLIAIAYVGSPWLVSLFTTDVHTQTIARGLLAITLWSYTIFGNARVLSGLMLSSGTVLWPTLISIGSIWGVEVPAAYLLMQRYGLDGVWYGYPIAYIASLAMQYGYYRFVWLRRPPERL